MTSRIALRAIALAALLAVAFVVAGCSTAAPTAEDNDIPAATDRREVIRIGYLPITHSAPLLVAHADNGGVIDGVALELVPFASWPELTEALNSGSIDGAVTMLEIALAAVEKGLDQRLVTLTHRNGDAFVVREDISSVAELAGERFAIPHRLSGHNILFLRALANAGLSAGDVEWIEMAPPDMPAALARGDIAGFIVAEPFGAIAVAEGFGHVLYRSEDLWPNWLCCGLVVTGSLADEDPETVSALVAALTEAGARIDADREAAAETAATYTQYGPELWLASFELGIEFRDFTPTLAELDELREALIDLDLIEGSVPADVFYDDSFAVDATP